MVGKFVEFYGGGLDNLSLADRATIANMAPEYGATCGIFPIDRETVNYLRLSGRDEDQVELVEAYAKAQGMWRDAGTPEADYSATLSLDIGTVAPSLAGRNGPRTGSPWRMPKTVSAGTWRTRSRRGTAAVLPGWKRRRVTITI